MRAQAAAVLLCLAVAAATVACDARPPLTFTPDTLPNSYLGVPYSTVITISGNQTPVGNVSADSGLPSGLTLHWDENGDRNRAEVSGTPTTAGTYQLTISAWCLGTNVSGQTGSYQYRIGVFSPDVPSAT